MVPAAVHRRVARPLLASVLTDRERGVLDAMTQHAEPAIREAGSAIGRFCSTSWIGDIDVPVVVVVTSRDRLVRPDRQRQLAASIPGARILPLDAGHLVAFTRPDVLAGAVATACSHVAERPTESRRRRFARAISRRLQARRRSSTDFPAVTMAPTTGAISEAPRPPEHEPLGPGHPVACGTIWRGATMAAVAGEESR